VAACQFPVTGDIARNAAYIRSYLRKTKQAGGDLLLTCETCLSGYPNSDFTSFKGYDWELLRGETTRLRSLARDLRLWLVLGSSHYLGRGAKPTNCLYIINPRGEIADRYDKCMCTGNDQKHYTAGNRLVVLTIKGMRTGFSICYDVCFPQICAAYRERGVKLMLQAFYNAGHKGPSCLDVLKVREVPTRCADNLMWAVATNSSRRYSNWGAFVARPDATILKQLPKNRAGMLVHDFPDGLSEGGWIHCRVPMRVAAGQRMHYGRTSSHPRLRDGRAEP